MKKARFILFAVAFAISISGCVNQSSGTDKLLHDTAENAETAQGTGKIGATAVPDIPTQNNDVFTDEFFADVVEICDTTIDPPATGERMEAVIRYLKGLTLTPTQEHLTAPSEDGQILYGGLDYLTFRKADGTEVTVLRSAQKLTISGEYSYIAEGENLNAGLKEAVEQSVDH